MIHDPKLIRLIQELPRRTFDGQVFRATGQNADPKAFSSNGGRWAPPDGAEGGCSILYTSTERNGALAEVASYLSLLTPVPTKPLVVHTLDVAPENALELAIGDFEGFGIDRAKYFERNYQRTQLIGAAINFLELDGLLAPSARWECENLMIFESNYKLDLKLEVISSEMISYEDWQALSGYERRFD